MPDQVSDKKKALSIICDLTESVGMTKTDLVVALLEEGGHIEKARIVTLLISLFALSR